MVGVTVGEAQDCKAEASDMRMTTEVTNAATSKQSKRHALAPSTFLPSTPVPATPMAPCTPSVAFDLPNLEV